VLCYCSDCERANRLLLSLLSPEQRQQLDRYNYFIVMAPSGHRYRVYDPSHVGYNVRLLDAADLEVVHFCAVVPNVPPADTMLAQKLMLETEEWHFQMIANRRVVNQVWVTTNGLYATTAFGTMRIMR